MSKKLRTASMIAVAATMISALASTAGSGAAAQDATPQSFQPGVIEEPFVPALSANSRSEDVAAPVLAAEQDATADAAPDPVTNDAATSLAQLVASQPLPQSLSDELTCLAGATYFEAKGESLSGQLAVARVVVARSKSGRFPGSYCGVVYQRSQFSFVRGRSMPRINLASRDWREAVAIARIAHANAWKSPTEGALFFHARYVSPGWRLKRVAQVDNHIFYR